MAERFGIMCAVPDCVAPPRTAHALVRHGAEVCVIAPPGSYVSLTRFKTAEILMPYEEMSRKLPSIARVLAEEFGAHSILAGDELAFLSLAHLALRAGELGLSEETKAMLVRSVPAPQKAVRLASDSAFITGEHDPLCPPPRSLANPSREAALAFAREVGFPLMLKRDGTAGGIGVTRCETAGQMIAAMAAASASTQNPNFVIQEFLSGPVYGVAVSGISGKAAAAFSFVKHKTLGPHGVATVLKHERRGDLIDHAQALYERYELNGYCGVDYILDASGQVRLLEINRAIGPKSHFSETFGLDLTEAMLALLRGQPIPSPRPAAHEFVALFPSEWMRDPASAYLKSAFHDVPWEDPAVLAAAIQNVLSKHDPNAG